MLKNNKTFSSKLILKDLSQEFRVFEGIGCVERKPFASSTFNNFFSFYLIHFLGFE